jgi:hypothetical protein
MDRLVAEKVMGWGRYPVPFNAEQTILAPSAEAAATVRLGESVWKLVPAYSASIAHAWEVMEKLGGMTLTQYGDRWACAAEREPMLEMMDMREGETAMLAICRAALAAVGL